MTKGVPWTFEAEAQLKKMVNANTPVDVIAQTLRRTPTAILVKCQRLGILATGYATTSSLPLPAELPSVEEALKKLAGALEAASAPGLSKVEVQRLQVIGVLARAYKDILADYLDYRGIEATCGVNLQEYNPETEHKGEYFAGLDLAQTRDYTTIAVVERQNGTLFLRHLKLIPATHNLRRRTGLPQSASGPLARLRADKNGLHP